MAVAWVLALAAVGAVVASARGPAGDGELPAVDAVPADAVVEAVGVNTHVPFLDSAYTDATALRRALGELGVRHARDELRARRPDTFPVWRSLAQDGVRMTFIMGDPVDSQGAGSPEELVGVLERELPGVAVALEGANEWDLSGRPGWVAELRGHQRALGEAVEGSAAARELPLYGPSVTTPGAAAALGPLAGLDGVSTHPYPGGEPPPAGLAGASAIRAALSPGAPLLATESGYHTTPEVEADQPGVPEEVAAAYLPRLLLDHAARGVERTFLYELVDSGGEAGYGLYREDWTPKPAAGAVARLLDHLEDPGPAFTPAPLPLRVTVAGDAPGPPVRSLLLGRRDGTYDVALWRETSRYDLERRLLVDDPPVEVVLQARGLRGATLHRVAEEGPGEGVAAEAGALRVPVSGEVVLARLDVTDSDGDSP